MNMKNIKYILFTAAAGLCLTLASCSEDKYEPGPELYGGIFPLQQFL